MHFMKTKRLQTIALAALYLMKKREMKIRFLEHKNNHAAGGEGGGGKIFKNLSVVFNDRNNMAS